MKKISDAVWYTGVLNPILRVFDVIMETAYGTSYNAYIVKGSEKTALIDTAHASFSDVYLQDIDAVLGDTVPDYLILNHTEPDHTGSVAKVIRRYPSITILGSQAACIYIKNITNIPDLKLQVIRDGDSIDLGDKTLRFINAPFLHWPDSMFTWLEEEKLLFSCDFLGCHFCEPAVFDTGIVFNKAYWQSVQYYFDCIFAPFKSYVRSGLSKIENLPIEKVLPSHGPILSKGCHLEGVIGRYREWSADVEKNNKLIPLFFCTAYGNTQKIALAIRDGIRQSLPDAECEAYNIIEHDMNTLSSLMNRSDAFLIGALTINRDAVPPIWQLLSHVDAVNIQKRAVALFGSYGWSGEGFKFVAERLASLKCNVYEPQYKICFVPTEDDLTAAKQYGAAFSAKI